MPGDIFNAYERAIGLVGVSVWMRLSDAARTEMFNEELARLDTECMPVTPVQPPDEHPQS